MLQDVIQPPQPQEHQLSIDEISSPISSARIFELCDNDQLLFQDSLQNCEVTSSSNCCHEEVNINSSSSYAINLSSALDIETTTTTNHINNNNSNNNIVTTPSSTTATSTSTTNNNNNLSIIFDSQEEIDNDISASIDFSSSQTFVVPPSVLLPPITTNHHEHQQQFDFSSLKGLSQSQYHQNDNTISAAPNIMGTHHHHQFHNSVFEDDCISSMPSFMPINPSSSSFYMPHGTLDSSGLFGGNILLGSDQLQPQDQLDYQGENNGGMFCTDQQVFNPSDFQALGTHENQQLVTGAGNSNATLAPEMSHLEDSSLKVGKLSVEQRKEKIHRYMKKRNERNFSKKIKYACRKTLADSRPRVRGRFAKNDEFGETQRSAGSNHEEDEEIVVKEGDDMVDSSDIFAHISGLNSFKCNYSIQSLI